MYLVLDIAMGAVRRAIDVKLWLLATIINSRNCNHLFQTG